MKISGRQSLLTALGCALFLSVMTNTGAMAATIIGSVTTDDKPVAGALVTLWNAERNRKETVYTDLSGHYSLTTEFSGKLVLRGRASNLKDVNQELDLAADANIQVDLKLPQFATPEEISAALTASAHAATLPFPDDLRPGPPSSANAPIVTSRAIPRPVCRTMKKLGAILFGAWKATAPI